MKKQCRRKIYAKVNPIAFVLEGIQPVAGNKLERLQLMELASLEALRTGKATQQDWWHLCSMMNVARQMAENGIGIEVQEVAQKAMDVLSDVATRWQKTGKFGITGPGLQVLRDLYEFHDLQRQSVSLTEYEKAIKQVDKFIRSKSPNVKTALCVQ